LRSRAGRVGRARRPVFRTTPFDRLAARSVRAWIRLPNGAVGRGFDPVEIAARRPFAVTAVRRAACRIRDAFRARTSAGSVFHDPAAARPITDGQDEHGSDDYTVRLAAPRCAPCPDGSDSCRRLLPFRTARVQSIDGRVPRLPRVTRPTARGRKKLKPAHGPVSRDVFESFAFADNVRLGHVRPITFTRQTVR